MSEQVKPDEAELARLKLEKNNRIRKNLRILALCAAAYYFISAGFSFYEESQDKKIRIDPEYRTAYEIDTVGAMKLLETYDSAYGTTLKEVSKANNQTVYAITCEGDHQGTLLAEEIDGKLAVLEITFKGANFKDEGLKQALTYAIALSENNTQKSIVEEVFKAMEYDPTAALPQFKNADLSSKKARYQVEVNGNEVKITCQALPQV